MAVFQLFQHFEKIPHMKDQHDRGQSHKKKIDDAIEKYNSRVEQTKTQYKIREKENSSRIAANEDRIRELKLEIEESNRRIELDRAEKEVSKRQWQRP